MRRDELAREAARAAAEFRLEHSYGRTEALCPFDAAAKIGLLVWLVPIPSLEGMYCKDRGPSILVSTERPPGRQAFTCGHELGHHIFGHGTRSDEYLKTPVAVERTDPEEVLADMFSAHLLMPPGAIRDAFAARQVTAASATPVQVYAVSMWLGVGYETLVGHMEFALGMITTKRADVLRRESPKQIRSEILGEAVVPHLVIADAHWTGRAIDLRVGDGVLLPRGCLLEGDRLVAERCVAGGQLAIATKRGLGRVESRSAEWSSFVRVMPEKYEGLSRFRFDEDPDENPSSDLDQ